MTARDFNALSDQGFNFEVLPNQELSPAQQAIKASLDHPGHPLNEAVRAIEKFGENVRRTASQIEQQGGKASDLKYVVEGAGAAFLQVDEGDANSVYVVLQPNVGSTYGKMHESYRIKLTSPKPARTYRLDSDKGTWIGTSGYVYHEYLLVKPRGLLFNRGDILDRVALCEDQRVLHARKPNILRQTSFTSRLVEEVQGAYDTALKTVPGSADPKLPALRAA